MLWHVYYCVYDTDYSGGRGYEWKPTGLFEDRIVSSLPKDDRDRDRIHTLGGDGGRFLAHRDAPTAKDAAYMVEGDLKTAFSRHRDEGYGVIRVRVCSCEVPPQ